MSFLVPFFVFCQALGALGGALSAVWGELAYARAIRDGNVSAAERAHLRAIAHGLRYGMFLLLLSSFALVVLAYRAHAPVQPALTASYWTLMALSLLITGVAWALSRRRAPFALASAVLFGGWWFLAYLALGLFPKLTFGATLMLYVVAVAIFYGILHYLRMLMAPSPHDRIA